MAEATLIVRLKAAGQKVVKASIDGLVKAFRLLRDAAKQAATPLRAVGAAATRAKEGLGKAATQATRAAKELRKVAKSNAGAALGKVTAASRRAATGLGKMGDAIIALNRKLRAMSKAADKTIGKLRGAGAAARTAGQQARTAGGLFAGFRSKLFDALLVTALVTGFVRSMARAAAAIGTLIRSAADASIEFTGIQITLKAATSSTDEFITASLAASDIARRYGVEIRTVAKGLADFLAATQTSTLAFEEQIAIFESLVRAGRVLNLSNERIRLSILAIGQIASKGSLQMEELKRQLESIPGAVPRLAKALDITVPELFARTSEGAILAAEALRGLRIVFNEIAAEQIVASMQALAAALGRLKVEADLIRIAFGDAAEEGFRKVVEATTQLTKDLQPLASELGSLASDSILPVSSALVQLASDFAAVIGVGIRFGDLSSIAKIVKFDILGLSAAASVAGVNLNLLDQTLGFLVGDLSELAEKARQVQIFKLSEEFRELEQAVLAGSVALTSAFENTAKGQKEAADQIAKINELIKAGTLSEVEALRLKKSIVLDISEAEQVAFELAQIQDRDRQDAIQRSIDKKIEEAQATKELGEFEKALAKDRIKAIGEAVQAAEQLARDRIAESERTRDEITDRERELLDARLAAFDKAIEGVEISAGKRQEIEEALSGELLDIEQKFQEKRQKLIDDANEAIKEDGSKRTEILEKLTEDLAKLLEKQGRDVDKLIKKRIDGAKKAADREIKEAERSAKKQKELLEGIGEALDKLEAKRKAALGEDLAAGDIAGPSIGAADTSELRSELDALNEKALQSGLTFEEFNRQAELLALLMGGAGAAVQSFGDDLVGVSQTRLKSFNESAAEAKRLIESFGDAPQAQQNIRDLVFELEQMAAQGNLTAEELATAFFSLAENIEIAKAQTGDSGLPELGEAGKVAAAGVSQVAEKLEAAGVAVRAVAAVSDDAVVKITNLGEEAEAAGGGVQILTEKEREAAEASQRLADAVGGAAAKEQELADAAEAAAENVTIPQEALDSITRLQEVLAGLELDPLLVPLETLAATMKSLSESVPLLPEPLQAFVASLLQLVEKEILGPLAEGFEKVNAQIEPLAEKLPIIAEAQADFNTAAKDSEEPLGLLEGGLKKLTEEELLGGLEKLAKALEAINDAVLKLRDGADAADDLAVAVADLQRELESFAEFIGGPFADALAQHAEDWQAALQGPVAYREELEDQIANVLPAWSDAASSMFNEPDARAEAFLAKLQEISRALDEVIQKSEALG